MKKGDTVEAQATIVRRDGKATLRPGDTAIVRTTGTTESGRHIVDLTLPNGWVMIDIITTDSFPLKVVG